MAKHNLFLGTATRSVGDITLMRRNGVQVSRVRVRQIANPRTEGQARQRMQFAAVTRFYAPLSACLERSWQGKNRTDSYSAFLKENLKRSKAMLFAVPRSAGFIPMPVQLSNGTMPNAQYEYNTDADAGFIFKTAEVEGAVNLGSVSAALISKYGLNDGDQITFIWSLAQEDGSYDVHYQRIFLDSSSSEAFNISGLTFEYGEVQGGLSVYDDDDRMAAFAVIFSRYENGAWRRSTQVMAVRDGWERDYLGAGAQATYLPEWMTSATVPTSDVYLNGSTAPSTELNLTAWTLNAAGNGVGDSFRVVGSHTGSYNGERVIFIDGDGGQSLPLMCMNTHDARYHLIPLANAAGGIDRVEDDAYTLFCTFQNEGDKNVNGPLGENAVLYLQTIGMSPMRALAWGGFID